MEEIKKYQINNNGKLSLKKKTRDFYEMIFGGLFLFYIPLLFAIIYTIDSEGYSIFLIIFLTGLYFFIFIIVPISLIQRINKVIRLIRITDNSIELESNKKHHYNTNEIRFKIVKDKFTGFGSRNMSGILLADDKKKEYWLVEDFFNDYEDLKKLVKDKVEQKKQNKPSP